jgi:hypothetical protein
MSPSLEFDRTRSCHERGDPFLSNILVLPPNNRNKQQADIVSDVQSQFLQQHSDPECFVPKSSPFLPDFDVDTITNGVSSEYFSYRIIPELQLFLMYHDGSRAFRR